METDARVYSLESVALAVVGVFLAARTSLERQASLRVARALDTRCSTDDLSNRVQQLIDAREPRLTRG